MSKVEGYRQYAGAYNEYGEGYLQYDGGNLNVLNTLRRTDGIPLMY